MSTDVMTLADDVVKAEPLMLVESKLYRLNVDENFLGFLEADVSTKMQVELVLGDSFPREDQDGNDTRIFMNFTNLNGNGATFKLNDDKRLARVFDIDGFMNGLYARVNEGLDENFTMEVIRPTLVTAINTAVMNALELTAEPQLPQVKTASENVLRSLVSTLLNDPLDAIILLQEQPLRDGQSETDAVVVGIWTVQHRD